MSGEWGPKPSIRATKADVLSLTLFETGLFGWMAIFQVTIFKYMLDIVPATNEWMMQVYPSCVQVTYTSSLIGR